jgi:hypothetical protein
MALLAKARVTAAVSRPSANSLSFVRMAELLSHIDASWLDAGIVVVVSVWGRSLLKTRLVLVAATSNPSV